MSAIARSHLRGLIMASAEAWPLRIDVLASGEKEGRRSWITLWGHGRHRIKVTCTQRCDDVGFLGPDLRGKKTGRRKKRTGWRPKLMRQKLNSGRQ